MKQAMIITMAFVALVAAAGGYWLGGQQAAHTEQAAPQKDAARKILYYRNPMGLPDTSPVPKKDAMGMDYVPVYEGEEKSTVNPGMGGVQISIQKAQKLGVKTEAAAMRMLENTVRATGRVEANERHIYTIAPKFEGWIDKLHVNVSGEPVMKGQALFDAYSPELVSAQREYAIAAQGVTNLKEADSDTRHSMQKLADASLLRLKNWDISAQQVQELEKSGATRRSLTFHSPVNGIVLEKKAVQGMRFMPGEMLYQIADLSSVWVIADIPEQDIAPIGKGNRARVKIDAYPDKQFDAAITYVYPTLNPATRTVAVRLELANPHGLLKPAMFAQVEIPVSGKDKVLTVPVSAVIDSGVRQVVLVQTAADHFEPREVRLGKRSGDYAEVLEGVANGEQVVVAANFLIDAESNLKAALGGFGHAHGGNTQGSPAPAAEHGSHDAAAKPQAKPAVVGHQGRGTLNAVNADGSINISHEAIESLGWGAMTMDFPLANSSLARGLKSGTTITFDLVERKPGEWVITGVQAVKPISHEGH